MTLLATTTSTGTAAAVPTFDWTAFAPELVLAVSTLVLLLLLVANRWRGLVGGLCAVPTIAVGVLLATPAAGEALTNRDLTMAMIVVALGVAFLAVPIALGATPRLIGPAIAGTAVVAALALTLWQVWPIVSSPGGLLPPTVTAGGSIAVDGVALLTRITVLLSTLLVVLLSPAYLEDRGIARAEFEPLVLLTAIGMTVLGAANDAITLFVALELLSIALYVLAGLARRDRRSQEAAIKYFIMGAVASALLLYGLALLYVATGSLDLPVIGLRLALAGTPVGVAGMGMALVTIGIGFKIAAVPFQLWTPDVYQGSPTNVTAFMAAGTKAAAFAVLLRLYLVTFAPLTHLWLPIVAIGAAATMLYGAVAALVQTDVKRILAYSAVAHAGYALIGVVAGGEDGVSSTLWYLLTYAVSTIAAFGVVITVERQRRGEVTLTTLAGLGRTSPILAGFLTLALLSLAGIPPTAGFAGKLTVFQAGVAAGQEWLVVIGVLSSVIAAFFYLRIIGAMFLDEPAEGAVEPPLTMGLNAGVSIAAAAIVFLGIQPQVVLDLAERTAQLTP